MEAEELLTGQRGKYAVRQRLPFAQGRISVLFEATDEGGRVVCVKRFQKIPRSAGLNAGFLAEWKAQQQLEHRNILRLIDYGNDLQEEAFPFIVYPLCRAGNLRDWINEREYVPLSEAIPILDQIASAVDFAHSRGVIHGDIKPENILFESDRSTPLLADFGMSKHFPHQERISTVFIGSGAGAGTTAYLSPEQIGEAKQSHLSDVYALGMVTFELLTGRLPFDIEMPPFKQMQAKVTGELTDAVEANPMVSALASEALRAALAVDRNVRPANGAALCQMLRGERAIPDTNGSRKSSRWSALDAKAKTAIITAALTALAGVITAFIKIIPELIK